MGINLKKQIAIVSCLYIGEMCVGYMAWSSPVIPKLQTLEQTPLPYVISDTEASWVGSAYLPGLLVGATLSGWISNSFGRKPCLTISGILLVTCYIILVTVEEFWMLIVGRCINGIGSGVVFITNLTYITEISSTNIRGIFLTVSGIFTSLGVLLVFIIGHFSTYAGVMYFGLCLQAAYAFGTLFLPETPAYHVLKGREIEAKQTLMSLGRLKDFEDILLLKPLKTKSRLRQGLRDVFCVKSNRKAFFISLVLYICQGLSGHIPLMVYATPIFQSVNSSIDPGVATIFVGVTQLASSCVTPLFVEKQGRKILLMVSTAGCFISMALLGTYFIFHSPEETTPNQFHWVPLFSMISFLIFYQSGYYTIPGACTSEMFDSSARGPGSSFTFMIGATICFITTSSFGYINSSVGSHVTFLTFAGASAVACLFTCVFVIETKGKTLAEVQLLLSQ